jgi:endonuclease/exonuclease/phosphatase family metal-dependent hydrolase
MGLASTKQMVSGSEESPQSNKFTVVTYNTFLRPHIVQNDAQQQRAHRIPLALSQFKADVLCLQECWSKFAVRQLIKSFQRLGYSHIVKTKKVKAFSFLHAGLMTCSRYPIVEVEFVPFDTCSGTDCLATKGFLYSQIAHPTLGRVHVFNIHLQFVTASKITSNDAEKMHIQAQQLGKWQHFVKARVFPEHELVVLAGDWNFDSVNNESEFNALLIKLQVSLPKLNGSQKVSVDAGNNNLVGRGNEARKYGCVSVLYTGENCACCPSRWVDFVMYSQTHLQPTQAVCQIQPLQVSPFTTRWTNDCTQLSDHYPVISTFTF